MYVKQRYNAVCEYTVSVVDVVVVSLGQHAFSRAYINLINQHDVALFVEKFDGYVFVDSRGNVTFISLNKH